MKNLNFVRQAFDLTGRVAIVTGGAGLLGIKHGEVIAELGGIPVLVDLDQYRAEAAAAKLSDQYGVEALGCRADVASSDDVLGLKEVVLDRFGRVDILINNAANNPKMETSEISAVQWTRLENFPLDTWLQDIAVGLTGAFLCSRIFGVELLRNKNGVILNIASDLGLIAPDQRIYRVEGVRDDEQPVKPVTYSVVKAGLIGLTRYLATYWASSGVRVNALAPGGVYTNQDPAFVERLTQLIPMGRMADRDEYKATVAFMISDASSYMTGAVVAVDGGRTCW